MQPFVDDDDPTQDALGPSLLSRDHQEIVT